MRPLLRDALQAAPLDYGEVWACALRYSVRSLASRSAHAVKEILDLVAEPLPAGNLPSRLISHTSLNLYKAQTCIRKFSCLFTYQ